MNASSIKNNGDYGISLFLFGLQYPRPSNLNTALAVDYLIKFSINRLETIAKSRKSKNLLNATKIALFAKNFANVPFIFVQIRHFSHLPNRYMPEYSLITIWKIFANDCRKITKREVCEKERLGAVAKRLIINPVSTRQKGNLRK